MTYVDRSLGTRRASRYINQSPWGVRLPGMSSYALGDLPATMTTAHGGSGAAHAEWLALQAIRGGQNPQAPGFALNDPSRSAPTLGPPQRMFLAGLAAGGFWPDSEVGYGTARAFWAEQNRISGGGPWALWGANMMPSAPFGLAVANGQQPELGWALWREGVAEAEKGGPVRALASAPIRDPAELTAIGRALAQAADAYVRSRPALANGTGPSSNFRAIQSGVWGGQGGQVTPLTGPVAAPTPAPETGHPVLQVITVDLPVTANIFPTLAWRVIQRGDRTANMLLGTGTPWRCWTGAVVRQGADVLVEVYQVGNLAYEAQNWQGVKGQLAPILDWPSMRVALQGSSCAPPPPSWLARIQAGAPPVTVPSPPPVLQVGPTGPIIDQIIDIAVPVPGGGGGGGSVLPTTLFPPLITGGGGGSPIPIQPYPMPGGGGSGGGVEVPEVTTQGGGGSLLPLGLGLVALWALSQRRRA